MLTFLIMAGRGSRGDPGSLNCAWPPRSSSSLSALCSWIQKIQGQKVSLWKLNAQIIPIPERSLSSSYYCFYFLPCSGIETRSSSWPTLSSDTTATASWTTTRRKRGQEEIPDMWTQFTDQVENTWQPTENLGFTLNILKSIIGFIDLSRIILNTKG